MLGENRRARKMQPAEESPCMTGREGEAARLVGPTTPASGRFG